eukprot:7231984-Pyramimonas_sp.AAC.1
MTRPIGNFGNLFRCQVCFAWDRSDFSRNHCSDGGKHDESTGAFRIDEFQFWRTPIADGAKSSKIER